MYREFFPITRHLIYLNHAAVTPLCRPAAEAMQGLAQDALEWGSFHYGEWLECYEGLRGSAARLVVKAGLAGLTNASVLLSGLSL